MAVIVAIAMGVDMTVAIAVAITEGVAVAVVNAVDVDMAMAVVVAVAVTMAMAVAMAVAIAVAVAVTLAVTVAVTILEHCSDYNAHSNYLAQNIFLCLQPFTINAGMTQLKEMSRRLRGSGQGGDNAGTLKQVKDFATSFSGSLPAQDVPAAAALAVVDAAQARGAAGAAKGQDKREAGAAQDVRAAAVALAVVDATQATNGNPFRDPVDDAVNRAVVDSDGFFTGNPFPLIIARVVGMVSLFDFPPSRDHDKLKAAYPEVNGPNEGKYEWNDELLGFSTLMLAYSYAVYHFENGAPEREFYGSQMVKAPELKNYDPSFDFGTMDYREFCSVPNPEGPDGAPALDNVREHTYSFQSFFSHHDSQTAIYQWEREHDQILTLAMRGSETDGSNFGVDAVVNSLGKVMRDWLGVDTNMTPIDDPICKGSGALLHKGFAHAWVAQSETVLSGLNSVLNEMKKKAPNKPVKVFVTGHSLGSAMAMLATYDLSCNKEKLGQELFGTITFGTPIIFWGKNSIDQYTKQVHKERRIRINTCAKTVMADIDLRLPCLDCIKCEKGWWDFTGVFHESCEHIHGVCKNVKAACDDFNSGSTQLLCRDCRECDQKSGLDKALCEFGPLQNLCKVVKNANAACEVAEVATCDLISTNFPDLWFGEGYLQPDDYDYEASWVRTDYSAHNNQKPNDPEFLKKDFKKCYGFPDSAFCHSPQRYSQGLRRDNKFNGNICAKVDDPENTKLLTPGDRGTGQKNYPEAGVRLPPSAPPIHTPSGETIKYGDVVFLINQYGADTGGATYLDTWGGASQGAGGFGVETSPYPNRDSGSGIWRVDSAEGKEANTTVQFGDKVHLYNLYKLKGGYLETYGGSKQKAQPGAAMGSYGVETSPSHDRVDGTSKWELKSARNKSSQVPIIDHAMVSLVNQYAKGNGGYLDSFGGSKQSGGYGVETSSDPERHNGSGTWMMVLTSA